VPDFGTRVTVSPPPAGLVIDGTKLGKSPAEN
jgi:hypothetical protein